MRFIYVYTNLVNGKKYVGQTNNLYQRYHQHKYSSKRDPTLLVDRAIAKYGLENFEYKTIAICKTLEDTNLAEQFFIKYYNTRDPKIGYNIDFGGGHENRSPETCKKISEATKGRISPMKGKKLTDEHKKNISESSMGKPGTNTGKEFSSEWRGKIAAANFGDERLQTRRFSPEEEEKICEEYINGKSTYYLANKYDCYRSLINAILLRRDVPIKESNYNKHKESRANCKRSLKEELEMVKLFNEGASMKEVSRKFNSPKTTTRNILQRHGIKFKKYDK